MPGINRHPRVGDVFKIEYETNRIYTVVGTGFGDMFPCRVKTNDGTRFDGHDCNGLTLAQDGWFVSLGIWRNYGVLLEKPKTDWPPKSSKGSRYTDHKTMEVIKL